MGEKKQLLLQLFLHVQSKEEMQYLFDALLTPSEQDTLSERIHIVENILSGKTQREVAKETGASLTTVSRGNREIKFGNGIFQKLFSRIS
jgi:Trp operon repressor